VLSQVILQPLFVLSKDAQDFCYVVVLHWVTGAVWTGKVARDFRDRDVHVCMVLRVTSSIHDKTQRFENGDHLTTPDASLSGA
jgi:hypothetical protein